METISLTNDEKRLRIELLKEELALKQLARQEQQNVIFLQMEQPNEEQSPAENTINP